MVGRIKSAYRHEPAQHKTVFSEKGCFNIKLWGERGIRQTLELHVASSTLNIYSIYCKKGPFSEEFLQMFLF